MTAPPSQPPLPPPLSPQWRPQSLPPAQRLRLRASCPPPRDLRAKYSVLHPLPKYRVSRPQTRRPPQHCSDRKCVTGPGEAVREPPPPPKHNSSTTQDGAEKSRRGGQGAAAALPRLLGGSAGDRGACWPAIGPISPCRHGDSLRSRRQHLPSPSPSCPPCAHKQSIDCDETYHDRCARACAVQSAAARALLERESAKEKQIPQRPWETRYMSVWYSNARPGVLRVLCVYGCRGLPPHCLLHLWSPQACEHAAKVLLCGAQLARSLLPAAAARCRSMNRVRRCIGPATRRLSFKKTARHARRSGGLAAAGAEVERAFLLQPAPQAHDLRGQRADHLVLALLIRRQLHRLGRCARRGKGGGRGEERRVSVAAIAIWKGREGARSARWRVIKRGAHRRAWASTGRWRKRHPR